MSRKSYATKLMYLMAGTGNNSGNDDDKLLCYEAFDAQ